MYWGALQQGGSKGDFWELPWNSESLSSLRETHLFPFPESVTVFVTFLGVVNYFCVLCVSHTVFSTSVEEWLQMHDLHVKKIRIPERKLPENVQNSRCMLLLLAQIVIKKGKNINISLNQNVSIGDPKTTVTWAFPLQHCLKRETFISRLACTLAKLLQSFD